MSEHRLSEIVIERPRHGSRFSLKRNTGYRKALDQITQAAIEEGLLCQYRIKPRHKSRGLSDHLGPVVRLLRSRVGQPWNQVHSELCQRLDPNTMAGRHVLDHVFDFVELHVEMVDGIPYRKTKRYGQGDRIGGWRRDRSFYVHPETGLLCKLEPACVLPAKAPVPPAIVVKDAHHRYHKIGEVWYLITFQDFQNYFPQMDILLKTEITPDIAWKQYGKRQFAINKRQCNKRDLKWIRHQANIVMKNQQFH